MNPSKHLAPTVNGTVPERVGFFDSGIGGVSIVHEFVRLRPTADVFYVADWTYCPYGEKPEAVVRARAHTITERLLAQGCQLIVVACNTATAVAIDSLREMYDVPFVGIEPAVKPAALHSRSGVVGILATPNTFGGRLYKETSTRFAGNVRIVTAVGEGFVELVEAGEWNSEKVERAVARVVVPLLKQGIDHLVLGSTHYPFLKAVIHRIVGSEVVIVDPSHAVALRAVSLLEQAVMRSRLG